MLRPSLSTVVSLSTVAFLISAVSCLEIRNTQVDKPQSISGSIVRKGDYFSFVENYDKGEHDDSTYKKSILLF